MRKLRKKPATKTQAILKVAGGELKHNPPKIVSHTRAKHGKAAAQKQLVAILLNKARKRGAKIKKIKQSSKKNKKY